MCAAPWSQRRKRHPRRSLRDLEGGMTFGLSQRKAGGSHSQSSASSEVTSRNDTRPKCLVTSLLTCAWLAVEAPHLPLRFNTRWMKRSINTIHSFPVSPMQDTDCYFYLLLLSFSGYVDPCNGAYNESRKKRGEIGWAAVLLFCCQRRATTVFTNKNSIYIRRKKNRGRLYSVQRQLFHVKRLWCPKVVNTPSTWPVYKFHNTYFQE